MTLSNYQKTSLDYSCATEKIGKIIYIYSPYHFGIDDQQLSLKGKEEY